MSTAGWFGRLPVWVPIANIVVCSVVALGSLLSGLTVLAVWSAMLAAATAWALHRRRTVERRSHDLARLWPSAFRVMVGFSIVSLGTAVLATVAAVQDSGGDRVFSAVCAGVLYLVGGFMVLSAVAGHRFWSSGVPMNRPTWLFGKRRRGCAYCAEDSNMYSGHVEQIASNQALQKVLVKCPRCGWLYEISPHGSGDAVHITDSEAAAQLSS